MSFGWLQRLNLDRHLTDFKDYHIPVALLVFGVTSAYHFHTGKDLGTNYINSLYAFYGFLAGHGISQRFGHDPDATSPGGGDGR
jgi:hypothetical protein